MADEIKGADGPSVVERRRTIPGTGAKTAAQAQPVKRQGGTETIGIGVHEARISAYPVSSGGATMMKWWV